MRHSLSLLWAIGLLLVAGSAIRAHIGDAIYLIYEIPDEMVAGLDLRDVSIEDWEDVVGDPTLLAARDFFADPTVGEGAPYDPADLDYRIWLGWNQSQGVLYGAMERIDDVFVNEYAGGDLRGDHWRHDGSFEFMVDGDHTGGQYGGWANEDWTDEEKELANNRTAQQFFGIADAPDGRHISYQGAGTEWYTVPPYADGGGGTLGEAPAVSIFEFFVTPGDDIIWNSEADSKMSELTSGKIIGFQISIPDFDTEPARYRAFHTITGQAATWRYAERFADARLVGVTVDENAPQLSMPALKGREGDIVTIPIGIVRASTVAGGDLTITYDPDILSFREVKKGELISGGDFVLVSNSSTSGRIAVSIAGARIIGQESGTLFELEFEAGEFQFGQANISKLRFFRRTLTNEQGESIPTLSKNGSFTLQLGLPGDVNQDGSITSADAILVLRSAVELITLDATQRVLADVNEDGRISSGDAVLILRKAVGLLAKAVAGTELSPKMAWGIPENRTDGKVAVPLLLEGDIYGGDFVVHYDVGVYKPAGVRIPGEMAVWAMDTNSLGELHFTAASAMPLRKLEVILERIEAEGESGLLSLEEAILVDGAGLSVKAEMSSVEVALAPTVSALPGQYALLANYPNPFNPSTTIRYDVPKAGSVVLRIYDVTNQMVRELVDASQAAGRYSVMWDGRDASGGRVANGVYLYELRAGDFRAIRKMVLMK